MAVHKVHFRQCMSISTFFCHDFVQSKCVYDYCHLAVRCACATILTTILHSFLAPTVGYLCLGQFFLEGFTLINNALMFLYGEKCLYYLHMYCKLHRLLHTSCSSLNFLLSSSRVLLSVSISTSALLHSSFRFVYVIISHCQDMLIVQ